MRILVALLVSVAVVAGACGGAATPTPTSPSLAAASPAAAPTVAPAAPSLPPPPPTPAPTPTPPACQRDPECAVVANAIGSISLERMRDHLVALTAVGSRDPRHPGHAKAIAYIKEQLGALAYLGVQVSEHRAVYQGIPLTNILARIDPGPAPLPRAAGRTPTPAPPPPPTGWILIGAHYDSIAKDTPGWRPTIDPAPGADDNGTGTAALLEYARVLANQRAAGNVRRPIVLAFFDGEELFFKGSAAYLQSLPKPYPYAYVLNIDMVGWNPIADRLDLLWYGAQSDKLRDRVKAANATYEIGVSPLVEVFANDPDRYILDTAPFGLAGIPSVTLAQRYGEADATFPGNTTFHTVNDTPDKITNARLWLKAAKLTLAVALELARD